jgi:hypothetical protein
MNKQEKLARIMTLSFQIIEIVAKPTQSKYLKDMEVISSKELDNVINSLEEINHNLWAERRILRIRKVK